MRFSRFSKHPDFLNLGQSYKGWGLRATAVSTTKECTLATQVYKLLTALISYKNFSLGETFLTKIMGFWKGETWFWTLSAHWLTLMYLVSVRTKESINLFGECALFCRRNSCARSGQFGSIFGTLKFLYVLLKVDLNTSKYVKILPNVY